MAATRRQIEILLRRLEGPLTRAFATAVRNARSRAQISAIVQAIESGDVDAVLRAAGIRDGMYTIFTEELRAVYTEGGTFAMAATVPKRLATEFNVNNPRAEQWLRTHSSQLITGPLLGEQRAAIQVMLQRGQALGNNPRTTALDIVGRIGSTGRRTGGVIGLTEQQARFVGNMTDDLINLDPRYFDRKLRDRRFDAMVRRSFESGQPLPAQTQQRIVERYEDRMLKHRGDTIGRTEALRALNEASDEAMQQVVEEGLAPKNSVTRIWRHSFGPNERDGHRMMHGQRRKLDEPFLNPITGVPLARPGAGPGSEVINCRCWMEHKVDFVAVEQAA